MDDLLLTAAIFYAVECLVNPKKGMTAADRAVLRWRAADEAQALKTHLECLTNQRRGTKEEIQRSHLAACLEEVHGNISAAARLAGMSRQGFYRAGKRLGVLK